VVFPRERAERQAQDALGGECPGPTPIVSGRLAGTCGVVLSRPLCDAGDLREGVTELAEGGSLHNVGAILGALGQYEAAREAEREAVGMYRTVAKAPSGSGEQDARGLGEVDTFRLDAALGGIVHRDQSDAVQLSLGSRVVHRSLNRLSIPDPDAG